MWQSMVEKNDPGSPRIDHTVHVLEPGHRKIFHRQIASVRPLSFFNIEAKGKPPQLEVRNPPQPQRITGSPQHTLIPPLQAKANEQEASKEKEKQARSTEKWCVGTSPNCIQSTAAAAAPSRRSHITPPCSRTPATVPSVAGPFPESQPDQSAKICGHVPHRPQGRVERPVGGRIRGPGLGGPVPIQRGQGHVAAG